MMKNRPHPPADPSPARLRKKTNSQLVVPFPALIIILAVCLVLLSALVHQTASGGMLRIDRWAFSLADTIRSAPLSSFFIMITFLGTGTFLIPMYILAYASCIRCEKHWQARIIALVALSSVLLGWILKPLFHRPRPLAPLVAGAGGTSFPSGHALGGFTFALLIIYLIWQSRRPEPVKWGVTLLGCLFSLLVGSSRIYLHVHFASDVLGSLLIALAWSCFLGILIRIFSVRRERRPLPSHAESFISR